MLLTKIFPQVTSFKYRLLINRTAFNFVPEHKLVTNENIFNLQNFIQKSYRLFVLTGAGISTESGIPDYRSKGIGLYDRSSKRPVSFQDFLSSEEVRKRYWARNFVGWKRFSSVQPNSVHYCLAKWEKLGIIHCLVTQNVDRLHYKAGSERVTELHGTSYWVRCLKCGYGFSRFLLQNIFQELNPNFNIESIEIRPDGDVDIDPALVNNFKMHSCDRCGGIIKPDVIFFGDNVPISTVNEVYKWLKESDAVLVLGSSLEVYSGYRFIIAASEQHKPIAIVNIGPTRADDLANLKCNVRCGDILPKIIVQHVKL